MKTLSLTETQTKIVKRLLYEGFEHLSNKSPKELEEEINKTFLKESWTIIRKLEKL